eukprot:1902350-Alexandrium_andersonii.AAC.1
MLLLLSASIENIGLWLESCPCHEGDADLLQQYSDRKDKERRSLKKRVSKAYKQKYAACPMGSRKLVELVDGGLERFVRAIFDLNFQSLLLNHRQYLSEAKWAQLLADFEAGKSLTLLTITV